MIPPNANRTARFRTIARDVFVLVLAEVIVLAAAWCLSPAGKAALSRLFRRKQPNHSTTIDV